MLESLDFISVEAAEILRQSKHDPAEYDRRHRDRDASIRLIVDHAVPIGVMADMLFDSHSRDKVELSRDYTRSHLVKWYRLGLISHAENSRLDVSGLRSRMPSDWDWTDPFARYRAAGIVSSIVHELT